jgi:hypothetical protein
MFVLLNKYYCDVITEQDEMGRTCGMFTELVE